MADFLFSSPGTYTIQDDGIRGNNTSVVRDSNGTLVGTIVHPTDLMRFTANTPGVHLIFNALDSFGTANVVVGVPGVAAQSPDSITVNHLRTDGVMTLVSNGSISEFGSDAAADIIAPRLAMSAATGVGTAANAVDTQAEFLEAKTNTGGINIANFGSVFIGALTSDIRGLDVATSGDLNFSTTGSIALIDTTGTSSVHGGDVSGNVTLTALGANSDISSGVNLKMISAPGGGIALNAGRDVLVGTGGLNFDNDLLATSFVTIDAGRDFIIDGTSNVRTGAFGGIVGGPVDIQAGRNIELRNLAGGLQTIEAFIGDVTFTSGPGGAFIENATFSTAVQASSITVNADIVQLNSGGLNGISGIGAVTIRPVTAGRAIDIGSAADSPAALSLSEAELDRVFTTNIHIGDANSGPVEFTAPISPIAFPTNLVVRSGTEILVRSLIALDGSLTLHAGDDLFFASTANFTTTNGGFTGLVDQVQDDVGTGGLGALNGAINVTTSISLIGNLDADTLNGTPEANSIMGLGGNDVLRGFGGNDMLDGGEGADSMTGGPGDDWFVVRDAADQVQEAGGEGADRVFAYVDWMLTAGANVETISTYNEAATDPIDLTGNALAQAIQGNAGANILDGFGGGDALAGFGGDDWYVIRDSSDRVFESQSGGNDRAFAYVDWTLGGSAVVETLSTYNAAASDPIDLAGNDFAQTIYGNAGSNFIDGRGGRDVLLGDAGADIYAFTTALGVDNFDTIFGFQPGIDKIGFAGISQASLAAGAYRVGTQAFDNDDRIIYDPATGSLYYDGDGVGGVAQILFAIVQGGPPILASDFTTI